ncbi:hypothetical protein H0H93_010870 [Arthromyces matolae]|nr:hypothetical protein H0H93_010870 [Arthromyces matolae]
MGLSHTASTLFILALAVQATPLPDLISAQLVHRDVPADPSTMAHNYAGVHSTRSYNPFDLSGIFLRMDPPIKEEVKVPPVKKEEHDRIQSRLEVESNLRDLEQKALAALHNKQIILFKGYRGNIAKASTQWSQNPREFDSQLSFHLHKLAKEIYDRVEKEFKDRDLEDVVEITWSTDPLLLKFSRGPRNAAIWLKDSLQPHDPAVQTILIQKILDLGYAYINKLTTPDKHVLSNSDRMILGYQLLFVASVAASNIPHGRGDLQSNCWLLYLMRDAEYAVQTPDDVKACLKTFDRHLTDLWSPYITLQRESNWEPGKRGGPSQRQKDLNKKRVQRLAAHPSGSG